VLQVRELREYFGLRVTLGIRDSGFGIR